MTEKEPKEGTKKIKFGVTMPPEALARLDQQATVWGAGVPNRSAAMLRIFLEWETCQDLLAQQQKGELMK